MRKFLLLWVGICFAVVLLPKVIDRFTPKIIYKEVPIYKIKKEIQYVEKPVFQGEKIIEKEKIVYTDKRLDLFIIQQIDEDTFVINITDSGAIWEVSVANKNLQGILLHRRRPMYPTVSASSSSVGWNIN